MPPAELDSLAQMLNGLVKDHPTSDQASRDVEAIVKDMQQQIRARMQEMMPAVESSLNDAAATLAQVKEQLDKVRKELQSNK